MFEVRVTGSFDNTERFLKQGGLPRNIRGILEGLGQKGVRALARNTPRDSGISAESWSYEVFRRRSGWEIKWFNSHVEDGFPIVIGLQYGHATGTGGWVQGRDFINPAMAPIFREIEQELEKAVKSA